MCFLVFKYFRYIFPKYVVLFAYNALPYLIKLPLRTYSSEGIGAGVCKKIFMLAPCFDVEADVTNALLEQPFGVLIP